MLNLKDYLTGAWFVPHEEIKPRAKWQYNGIIKQAERTQDPRTPEKIWKDTYKECRSNLKI